MSAIGFGSQVTGGGKKPGRIMVTSGKQDGSGTLAAAIDQANAGRGQDLEIVITTDIEPNETTLVVRARNLTIRAEGGTVINRNHLEFDCTKADNIWLTNLRFDSDGLSKPRDTITINAREGRGKTGFWIDHCSFEAYYDLSITTNTRDKQGEPPLLITISHCRFHDWNPNANRDHGGIGIHGTGDDAKGNPTGRSDRETNAYATIYRNYFENVRRRSPRSTHKTFVHAFNNVLKNWGIADPGNPPDQVNGMASGNFGILAAEANYFDAGVFKSTIQVAKGKEPGRLIVGTGKHLNLYVNGALDPLKDPLNDLPLDVPKDSTKAIEKEYAAVKMEIPQREPMTKALSEEIRSEAGPRQG